MPTGGCVGASWRELLTPLVVAVGGLAVLAAAVARDGLAGSPDMAAPLDRRTVEETVHKARAATTRTGRVLPTPAGYHHEP